MWTTGFSFLFIFTSPSPPQRAAHTYILLTEEDFINRRALTEIGQTVSHNAVQDEEGSGAVAAVQHRIQAEYRPDGRVKYIGQHAAEEAREEMSATDRQALADSQLCYHHKCFAEVARICRKLCSWMGTRWPELPHHHHSWPIGYIKDDIRGASAFPLQCCCEL
jgi:hypothetical protein